MSRTQIHTFYVEGGIGNKMIPVLVYICGLPRNFNAFFHSAVENNEQSWFIFFSVQSGDSRIEYFYKLITDSRESSDYVLNIDYDSSKAVCSFNSTEQIVFVNSNNDKLSDQTRPMFYECLIYDESKIFLVIFQNNIVLFWKNDEGQVVVKTLDFSTSFDLYSYHFTRVNYEIDLTNEHCKITFCTDPSDSNTYSSAYFDIESFLKNNDVSVILKFHRFNQMCSSLFSGSQFEPDSSDVIGSFTINLIHSVDGEPQEDSGSEAGSDAGSDAGSEEDDY
jgi:hypothetical protein